MADDQMEAVSLLQKLSTSDAADELTKNLDDILSYLQNYAGDELDCQAYAFVEAGILTEIYKYLTNYKSYPDDIKTKLIKVIAEIAKGESVREPCVEKGFIPPLVDILKSTEEVAVVTQVCRSLGNICFDNDEGRQAVDKEDGIPALVDLLKNQLKTEGSDASKLRMSACGALLNVTNLDDNLMEKAAKEGALEVLEQYVWQHRSDRELCNMTLLTIGSFLDSEVCQEQLKNSTMCSAVVRLLDTEFADQYQNMILELFIGLAEVDEVKDLLAETNLSSHLIRVIQLNTGKHDEDSQQTVKMASDLLVLLLTGDKSMEIMFGNGDGVVVVETIKWLESDSAHLQLSACLAIGNFARSDDHCKKLLEQEIVSKLLNIIQEQNRSDGDITLQHAVLSALRNLAIPVSNKLPLLKAGVLETVLGLISSETMAVVFKLLGVLRMLIDGQEAAALQLGTNKEFLGRLVQWCDVDEHAGVQGEASRLLASLVKNGRSSEVMRNIVRMEGIEHLVAMASSEHVVMQNEALMALTLIGSSILADAAMALKQSELTETITNLLNNEKTLPEILCNTLTLTQTICSAATPSTNQMIPCSILACTGLLSDMQNSLKEDIVTSGIEALIRGLTSHEDEKVRNLANTLLTTIQELDLER